MMTLKSINKAPGDRGGHVVGQTASGRPKYAPDPEREKTKVLPKITDEMSRQYLDSQKEKPGPHEGAGSPVYKPPVGAVRRRRKTQEIPEETMDQLMSQKSTHAQSGDYEPLPKEFMADVAKSADAPGDADGDEVDVDMKEATERAVKGFTDYGADDDDNDDDDDYQKATQKAIATLKKHAPAGAGQGMSQLFGGTPGGGFMQGMGYGQGIGSEAASGQIEAPHTLAHLATSKVGQMMNPPMHAAGGMGHPASAPAAPGMAPAPAPAPAAPMPTQQAAPAPHQQSAGGGGMGGGAHGVGAPMMRSIGMCAACKAGTCKDHKEEVDKALTSRSLAIPVYMRRAAYDPNDTFRSATTQTSRMYSSIAPDVADTLAHVKEAEDVRTRHAQDDLKRSQEIAEMRTRMLNGVRPRTDIKFGG